MGSSSTKAPEVEFSGYAFHRALRKRLDSDASSVCWNAIYLLLGDTWEEFCRTVRGRTDPLKARCKNVLHYGECHGQTLFLIGLRMLTDEEWEVLEEHSLIPITEDEDE